ncbi:MAG: glutamyl-tRNA reductase [Candidatus Methanomethylicaceae archaeon]
MLSIHCLSISHKKSPVRILESFTLRDIGSALNKLKEEGAEECVIVQTCHRVEFYAVGPNINGGLLKEFLMKVSRSKYQIDSYGELFEGEEALRHLFYVAAGLESVIVGETEILHQIEDSLKIAKASGTAKTIMESIFVAAINCGRMVRRKTSICKGSVSLGNLVIKTILNEIGSLEKKKLVIIGAGKIGCMIAKSIPRRGTVTVFVANRTYSRAERLANEVGGIAVNFGRLREVIIDADAIVCATSSPHLVLTKEDFETIDVRKRLLIVDVSNPRGVDERIKEIPGIDLVDLDQINSIARRNLEVRENSIHEAKEIIERSLKALKDRFQLDRTDVTLERLMRWAEVKRRRALQLAFKRFDFTDDQRKALDELTYAFMRDIILPLANSGIKAEGVFNEENDYIQT